LIQIAKLRKTFGSQLVLDDVSIRFGAGERVALIGQNGSGKTTLIRCLLGLYTFDGEICVDKQHPRQNRELGLRHISFVPQLPPGLRLSVAEYVRVVCRLTGVLPAEVQAMCSQLEFDIDANAGKLFVSLSGGMKQKLMIATALARKPRLLIMDEPAANLDPQARGRFYEALQTLPESTTMLLSSHRIDEIAGLVTRLVELDHGKVVLDDVVAAHSKAMTITNEFFSCTAAFLQISPSMIEHLMLWGLKPNTDHTTWTGRITSHDRFRFLSMVTRWSAKISRLEIMEDRP